MKEEIFVGDIHVTHCASEGSANGETLVLVHGSFGAGWMWGNYIPVFIERGFTVYAPSLRGHGKSKGSVAGATMQDYADDVHAVVSGLGIENPIVIGHSMGGLVALLYVSQHGARALVSIGGSPTLEVMGGGEEKSYPETYTAMDAGMPTDPVEVMKALPDLEQETLMMMKDMLGLESGVARSERKRGVSVPKEAVANVPKLFMGSELADSVGFGINAEWAHKHAAYYGGESHKVKGSTHPGILMGKYASDGTKVIVAWLEKTLK